MARELFGRVAAVMIKPPGAMVESMRRETVEVTLEGFEGDRHCGLTALSDGHISRFPRGTRVRNTRQITILSVEELAEIARALDVPTVEATWLSGNLLLEGLPALTCLPPSTRLFFDGGAVLVIDSANSPCTIAGGVVASHYPDRPGLTSAFPKAALHLRGVVAWVERAGTITEGDGVRALLPAPCPRHPPHDG